MTHKSDETLLGTKANALTNAEFLNTIFSADLADGHTIWVTDFADDPGSKSTAKWLGRIWDGTDLPEAANNAYFSVAALKPNAQGGIRRIKDCFAGMRCIILDDVGTKAESPPIEPSWLLETSPGNFQAGFIFEEPITDTRLIHRLCKQLSMDGRFTDTGGFNGVRYARLPVGCNTKSKVIAANDGNPFPHRLAAWNPELRYNWRDWSVAMGLGGLQSPANDAEYGVFEDVGDENPVVAALKSRGLYKRPLGSDGGHDITCPWVDSHTDAIDSGTAYFEPSDEYRRGGFKCHHGHCAERSIATLLEFLQVDQITAQHRPVIRCLGGEIHTIVARAEEILSRKHRYFQQGGMIVRVVSDQDDNCRIAALNDQTAQIELTRIAAWLKLDRRVNRWLPVDCPPVYSSGLLNSQQYPTLAKLVTLARQPFLRLDGSLCNSSGYDPASGMFGVFDPRQYPILLEPTRADAEAALHRLKELLVEFPFQTPHDQAAALAAMITAVVRPSLETAPGFLVTAHSSGSGKSYLIDIICALADEGQPAAATFTGNDEEMRKELIAKLQTSPALIKFDEIQGDLKPIKAMLSALSGEFIEGRILGVTKMVRLSTRSLFLFCGNNIDVLGDMARRIVTITLDPQVEIPAAREFEDDPLKRVRANRGTFISDVLTIVRAYQRHGTPSDSLKPTNGYGEWSDLCREPLVWLGLPDPCAAMFEQLANDPYREQLGSVLQTWYEAFGSTPRMLREVIKAAESNKDLEEAILTVSPAKADTIDRRHLGWWMRKNVGKVIDGKRFARDTTRKRNAEIWLVEQLQSSAGMTTTDRSSNKTDSNDLTDSPATLQSRSNRESRDCTATGAEVSAQSHANDDGEVF